MHTFTVFLFVVAATCVLTPAQQFNNFVVKHKKQYASAEERANRFEVFKNNLKRIEQYNAAKDGATYGITKFADLTEEEFLHKFTTAPRGARHFGMHATARAAAHGASFPASFDWRDHGAVTPVKDQGQCGSCWAFSSIQNAEGVWAAAGNSLQKFAPQQLVDCVSKEKYNSDGCNGGFAVQGSSYIVDTGGIELEEDYPYEGEQKTCRFNSHRVAARFTTTTDIPNDDDTLAAYMYEHGPASIGVRASNKWQLYTGGILPNEVCYFFNHDVLAVGWGEENGQKYWIVKNSWTSSWGENGYIRVTRGDNCISKDAHSIVL